MDWEGSKVQRKVKVKVGVKFSERDLDGADDDGPPGPAGAAELQRGEAATNICRTDSIGQSVQFNIKLSV